MKWAVLQYCVIRPAYVTLVIVWLRITQLISELLWRRWFLNTWAFIAKLPGLRGGVTSMSVASHGFDGVVLIKFSDCGDRLGIRHHRHVLFNPALRRGLRTAQATQTVAQTVLREGSR